MFKTFGTGYYVARISYPGSKWQKFDFHTHSPASDHYGHGDESLKKIHPEEWLRKTMESGLDCVVVADHNAGGWIDKLKTKNKEIRDQDVKPGWYRDLTIFPGVLGSCGITTGFGDDTKTSTSTGFVATVKKSLMRAVLLSLRTLTDQKDCLKALPH